MRAAAIRGALGLALAALLAGAAGADPAPAVRIGEGLVRGADVDGLRVFKGIPYAAPPVGERRWRAPAPPAAWSNERDATAFGPDCIQTRPAWDPTQSKRSISEDCLTLNLWAPTSAGGPSPVMVWIHGGGFTLGSGSQPIFDGAALARRGVIVVTFNYRLGRFGFFAHPALSAEAAAANEPTGDFALMDQIAALRWVRRNISAFGGDPASVTVFGESAGGGSVEQLMLIEPARGLFARAISQSGGGRDDWPLLATDLPGKPSAETIGKAFAAKAGIAGDGPQALTALRALPAARVLDSLDMLHAEPDTYSGPMIDGRLVVGRVDQGFAAGKAAPTTLLIGANSNELGFIPALFRGPINAKAAELLGADAAAVKAAYGSGAAYGAHLASDVTFVEPARFLASQITAHGGHAWLYSFGYVPTAKRGHQDGAPHASDLAFVFGNLGALDVAATPDDAREARLIGDYWVAFAKTGDPNGDGRPAWPGMSAGNGPRLDFTDTDTGAAAARFDSTALDAIAAHFTHAAGSTRDDHGGRP